MLRKIGVLGVAVVALGLTACGGTNSPTGKVATSDQHGTLIDNPPLRVASVNATDFAAQLNATASGPQLLQLAGTPACGVDFYYFKYWTTGPDNSAQLASGALMVPTGSAAPCTGPRPIVLYAHGSATDAAYNIAAISDTANSANGESALVAAVFAAQGYIVVAPNYLGYDISTLGYHPYLVGDQNANVMMDALEAARSALLTTFTPNTSDNGKLFVTGYSEGGYVAMATVKAMQAAGDAVTACGAGFRTVCAGGATGDAIFFGQVNIDSTVLAPLLTTELSAGLRQRLHSDVRPLLLDLRDRHRHAAAEHHPDRDLISSGKLPETALFDISTPKSATGNATLDAGADQLLALPASPPYSASQAALFDTGFGSPYLISDTYRVGYVDDAVANPDQAEMTLIAGGTLSAANVGARRDLDGGVAQGPGVERHALRPLVPGGADADVRRGPGSDGLLPERADHGCVVEPVRRGWPRECSRPQCGAAGRQPLRAPAGRAAADGGAADRRERPASGRVFPCHRGAVLYGGGPRLLCASSVRGEGRSCRKK